MSKRAMLFVDAQNLEQTAQYHYDETHAVDDFYPLNEYDERLYRGD